MCDVDYFKVYNDTYGHQAGDQCLQQIAQAITAAIKRPADCVARYGGEEFAVVLPNTDLAGAIHVAEAVLAQVRSLRLPHTASPINSSVTLSLGVFSQIPSADTPADLVESADQALYLAKEKGRDRIQAYEPKPAQLPAHPTLDLVGRVRNALDTHQFQLYGQLIQSQQVTTPSALEIQIYLCDQPGVTYSPRLFAPVAERYGLMTRLDQWIIQQLCASSQTLPQDMKLFIQLSRVTWKSRGFGDFLQSQLEQSSLKGEQLCFEFPSTLDRQYLPMAAALSHELHGLGCSIALDDFGNPQSSFSHLRMIPAHFVKIDGLLVVQMMSDPVAKGIVEATRHLAGVMGIQTIAEHVDSQGTADHLAQIGIEYLQGSYVGAAGPLTEDI